MYVCVREGYDKKKGGWNNAMYKRACGKGIEESVYKVKARSIIVDCM